MRKKGIDKAAGLLMICFLLLCQPLIAPAARAAGISITVNGAPLQTDAAPYIQDGRVLVPFRALFEALGASVNWDEATRTVTGATNGTEVRLAIGSSTAYVNNNPEALDVPAAISGGRTFVPLRFVGEALGATVQWDGANSAVTVTLGAASASTATSGVTVSKIITIKDSYGNIVLVPSPPKRIVSCNPNVAEAICILGAADSIVGRSTTTVFPPVLQSKTDVGSWMTPNAEKILSLKPDLFFGYGLYTDKGIVAKLKSHGIPVVMLDCYFLHSMTKDMTTLGQILGREREAADFNAYYTKYANLVVDRTKNIPESSKPKLLFDGYMGDYRTASKGSSAEELLNAVGARNLADNLGVPFPKISSEWVLANNPQVILEYCGGSMSGYGQSASAMKRKQQEVMQRPGWNKTDAVKNGRILMISSQIFTTARAPIGMLYMAKYLYPDLFKDVDPDAVHKEWLSKFYGLQPNGAWVYPAPQ
jgi:iron complex transport system substrate-binding protein